MPVSPAAFQQSVWNPILDPTSLTRGGTAVLDTTSEWSPDPGFDNAAAWDLALDDADVNSTHPSELTFLGASTVRGRCIATRNALGIIPPDGVYRFTVPPANNRVSNGTAFRLCFGKGTVNVTNLGTTFLTAGGDVDVTIAGATDMAFGLIMAESSGIRANFSLPSLTCRRLS